MIMMMVMMMVMVMVMMMMMVMVMVMVMEHLGVVHVLRNIRWEGSLKNDYSTMNLWLIH